MLVSCLCLFSKETISWSWSIEYQCGTFCVLGILIHSHPPPIDGEGLVFVVSFLSDLVINYRMKGSLNCPRFRLFNFFLLYTFLFCVTCWYFFSCYSSISVSVCSCINSWSFSSFFSFLIFFFLVCVLRKNLVILFSLFHFSHLFMIFFLSFWWKFLFQISSFTST